MSDENWHKSAPHHAVRTKVFMNWRGIYSRADEKFVKKKPTRRPFEHQLDTFSYRTNIFYTKVQRIRRNDVPIEFKASPDTLLNLAAKVVDRFPLPKVYEWTTFECCKWMREYGYPQYQNTLRVNLITGRKLLLLDAQSLSAMNIKKFNHIKHITYGIRQLFYFEMTKFARSIALPPQYHLEMYKLFRVQTGPRYDATRPTDLWRQLQMLREVSKPATHWDLLERWLALQPDTIELIGEAPRRKLYRCKLAKESSTLESSGPVCECQHYCYCKFAKAHYKEPSVLSVLKPYRTKKFHARTVGCCKTCLPPCTCNWPSRYYQGNELLNYLKQNLPIKYSLEARTRAHIFSSVYRESIRLNRGDMRGLFAKADEKFVKAKKRGIIDKQHRLRTYKFQPNEFLGAEQVYDRIALPIIFKVTPDTLLNLCINVVDALPLPTPHKWTTLDVCKWIRSYGYPHYMTTFRVNFITGQKLLLLDASALSAMNIKNFADIKHIAYGIRQLFFYEMTKYIRNISLPREYYYELYKLFETKSGPRYQDTLRSELWRQMHLIREKSPNYSHWELLERWMAHKRGGTELFGGVGRYRLYKCKSEPSKKRGASIRPIPCRCMPPCSCFWTEKHRALPTVFSLLKRERQPDQTISKAHCRDCAPPCTCHWPPRYFEFDRVLTCLKQTKPTKYGLRRSSRFEEERIQFRPSLFNTD